MHRLVMIDAYRRINHAESICAVPLALTGLGACPASRGLYIKGGTSCPPYTPRPGHLVPRTPTRGSASGHRQGGNFATPAPPVFELPRTGCLSPPLVPPSQAPAAGGDHAEFRRTESDSTHAAPRTAPWNSPPSLLFMLTPLRPCLRLCHGSCIKKLRTNHATQEVRLRYSPQAHLLSLRRGQVKGGYSMKATKAVGVLKGAAKAGCVRKGRRGGVKGSTWNIAPLPYPATIREPFGVYCTVDPYVPPARPTPRRNPTQYDRPTLPVVALETTDIDGDRAPFVWEHDRRGDRTRLIIGKVRGVPMAGTAPSGRTKDGRPKELALYACPLCGGVREDLDAEENFDDLKPGQYRTRELVTGFDLVEHGGVCASCYAEDFGTRHPQAMPGDAEREEREPLPTWAPTLTSCLDCVHARSPRHRNRQNVGCILQPTNATRVNCGVAMPAERRSRVIRPGVMPPPPAAAEEPFTEENAVRFWDERRRRPDVDDLDAAEVYDSAEDGEE